MGQQLRLTPQLQQAIRLLGLSTQELQETLQEMVEQNPLLEIAEEPGGIEAAADADGSERVAGDGLHEMSESREAVEPAEIAEGTEGTEGPAADPPDTFELSELTAGPDDRDPNDTPLYPESFDAGGDGPEREVADASEPGLMEHLLEQVADLGLSRRDEAWLEALVYSLNDDGYLEDPLEELVAHFSPRFESVWGMALTPMEINRGLHRLQSLDPPGIGARSLKECLLLQLARIPGEAAEQAEEIVTDHLEMIGSLSPASLAKKAGISLTEMTNALACIRQLNPRPGAAFSTEVSRPVIPEVIVSRGPDGRWVARPAPGSRISLRLSPHADRLRPAPAQAKKESADAAPAALQQMLTEAKWLIRNLEQRESSILRVAQAIVEAQQEFFSHGPQAMRPLVLRDIAEVCELHESTVSRITSQKYLLAPQGCLEFKYFFGTGLRSEEGEDASATAIRAKIAEWVAAENTAKPLSDQVIADRFQKDLGITVARRTIAKYREALRIPNASLRKQSPT